ncbi:hypothetical protein LNKW23_28730 [Paralimibaculum aggregatum]|uniref:OmpH family outer membrane protein n=1 Tax=Paralimibaculum aggregatum TaxID=3036245 RepID=A0ABQ6LMY8_9RHOB|nr:OmpH family outer membrane protein [Limibaculum sp. NKW23]GMG83660.1 hypothetical protein LNKW23_28730 [Limibaculum sp. NKW23]
MLARRAFLAGLGAAALGAAVPARAQEAQAQEAGGPRVIVVSRDRVLRESAAGRALRRAEQELSIAFQARVDAITAEIEAEEAEITQLRGEISREEFERRAARFDSKVRIARRRSQRRASELQQAVRAARERLSAALGPVLIALLKAEGAEIVLDADDVLVAAPTVNRTEAVIALFDAQIPAPEIVLPEEEALLPTEEELDAATFQPDSGE